MPNRLKSVNPFDSPRHQWRGLGAGERVKFFLLSIILLGICMTQSGCALLALPFTLLNGLFGLLGQAANIISKMPMPPPGVFF
jgi:hypothetical protein